MIHLSSPRNFRGLFLAIRKWLWYDGNMKVKRVIVTGGIALGSLIAAGGASAVSYVTSSDVQFTFEPTLSLTLSADDFLIDDLTPGNSDTSNAVTATVTTNSSVGYNLSATVGNATYTSTDLVATNGTFSMIGTAATALSAGTWGYTLDNGTTYGALALSTPTYLNKTVDNTGTADTGYAGGNATVVKIGAYADTTQNPGSYRNVVNFTALSNMATRTVTVASGANVSSVVLGASGVSRSYLEGETVNISATCNAGSSFGNWSKSNDFGTIASPTTASTTYTVGAGDVMLTAHCIAD